MKRLACCVLPNGEVRFVNEDEGEIRRVYDEYRADHPSDDRERRKGAYGGVVVVSLIDADAYRVLEAQATTCRRWVRNDFGEIVGRCRLLAAHADECRP